MEKNMFPKDPVGSNVEFIPSYIARERLKSEQIHLFDCMPVLIGEKGDADSLFDSD